ncbi:hypothetical protein [Pararhizobium sp.]|uniref:hypothetical protein n=1 Tax=Pararhizobium sp. TaxID=1977563 RepID=UPI003D11A38F
MPDDAANPSVARGLYRLSVFFGCVAFVAFFLWEVYSTAAAVSRLSAAADNFPYIERCDANGNLIETGEPNCVDLGRYLFINGPVLKALRRPCGGRDYLPGVVVLEEGAASRKDIVSVEKALSYRKRNRGRMPC